MTDLKQQIRANYNTNTVKRWTRRDDLFKNRFVILPMCENSHWFMAVINNMDKVAEQMRAHIVHCQQNT